MKADKVYLVGFMAAGKTTLARALGKRLDWRVEDVDERIEAREGRTIASIFAREGEAYFRAVERAVLLDLLPCGISSSPPAAARSSTPTTARPSTATGSRSGSTCRSPRSSIASRQTDAGRSPPTASNSNASTPRGGWPISRRTCDSMPRRAASAISWSRSSPPWTCDMRYLILSDIHGNLEALEAVLAAVDPASYDATLVLGDLVGYGADPNAVIDACAACRRVATIRGNHDKVAAGVEDAEGFNTIARSAVSWTMLELSPENAAYLAALEQGPHVVDDLIEICHGTPYDEDAYVFDELDALRALESAKRPRLPLWTHAHPGRLYAHAAGPEVETPDGEPSGRVIADDRRYLINPGSVGQPRDGDPRAAFAIADTDSADAWNFAGSITRSRPTQQKVLEAGLPGRAGPSGSAGRTVTGCLLAA